MEIIGHYSNGAVRLAEYIDMGGRPHGLHIAYPDCPDCKGAGVIKVERQEMRQVRIKRRWVDKLFTYQKELPCPTCKERVGDKVALKARIQNVIQQVEADVHTYAPSGKYRGITVDRLTQEPVSLEDYNVNSPLAKEYRRLLKAWWAYQEPEYTPVVKS